MIEFTKSMEIGIPHIDSQHRSLAEFANKAALLSTESPSKEKMKECLDFLAEYVVIHFNDEEELQFESGYPRYALHKEIHQEFIRTYLSMCAEFEKNGPTEALTKALNKRVGGWIVTHIKMEDVRFGEHYAAYKRANES